jgi:hypothetical protein
LTEEEIEKMFIKADLDDDGFVTSDDFYNIMTHKVYWDQWYPDLFAYRFIYLTFYFVVFVALINQDKKITQNIFSLVSLPLNLWH